MQMQRQKTGQVSLVAGPEPLDAAPPATSAALWDRLRKEAEDAFARERALAPLFVNSILNRSNFEDAVVHRVSARLGNEIVPAQTIGDAFAEALAGDPAIAAAFRFDILAVLERDPACERLIEPFLYFKGFHAIQTHRLAHWLLRKGRVDFALYLQSRSSDVFQTDINPAARIGKGLFLDHATGLVVGSTAVIDDDVSILQNVTLGGTGKESGDRHPKVRSGVMIGAGAKILGNIEIGSCARIAAGAVVLHPVAPNTTVAGVPARQVGAAGGAVPARDMNQVLSQLAYDSFAFDI
jgi:serine O-acetyltransferase